MEKINIKLPIYKQAYILAKNFKELGIKCTYNQRTKETFLSLLNAPNFSEGIAECELTLMGIFDTFIYVRDNFEYLANEYKERYKEYYKNNPSMLKYLQ